jgi:hypothetical protein
VAKALRSPGLSRARGRPVERASIVRAVLADSMVVAFAKSLTYCAEEVDEGVEITLLDASIIEPSVVGCSALGVGIRALAIRCSLLL